MRIKVNRLIDRFEMLHDGDTVVVGVSGGADSVCLLFLLCEIKKANIYDVNIEVVHMNHLIRETAMNDAQFVEKLCKEFSLNYGFDIKYHLAEANVKQFAMSSGLSVEEAGRICRYDAFNKVLGDRKGVIAVAHHANDRAETMIFNLFRGSGLKGLTGILPKNGNIIRPLINTTRVQIEEFLKNENLSYITDETNLTDDYTRNKIRHNIIDYAENEICTGAVKNMCNTAEQLEKVEDFVTECTIKAALRSVVYKDKFSVVINLLELIKEHEYIIDRVLYESIVFVSGKKKDITSEHVRRVRLLIDTKGSKEIDLPYNITARKEYDRLTFVLNGMDEDKVNNIDEYQVNMRILNDFSMDAIPVDTYTKWFDYDKISSVATLRYRQEGDFLIVNKNQRKSLKDYFINEKIPSKDRDRIPLLADRDHIMWIIGKRISEYYKVSEETSRVLEVQYERKY